MRWRSLLVLVLLLLGGAVAAWVVLHSGSAAVPAASRDSSIDAHERARETLEADSPSSLARSAALHSAPNEPAATAASAGTESLRGRVVDEHDQPVPAFDLELGPGFAADAVREHVESAQGEFLVTGLAPGRWWVSVRTPVLQMQDPELPIVLPHEPIVVRMVGAALVTGIVLDLAGEPVAEAMVENLRIRNGASWVASRVNCDEVGRFRFESLDPGLHAFRAKAVESGAPSETVVLTLAPGIDAQEIRLFLRRGGTIDGEIEPTGGDRIRQRSVKISQGMSSLFESSYPDAESDESGHFRFEHVPAGSWWVLGEGENAGGNVFLTAQCTVRDGETTHVVLGRRLEDSVWVQGRLLRHGEPIPGAGVLAFLDGAPAFQTACYAEADEQGRYSLVLVGCGLATFLVSRHHFELDAPALHRLIPRVRQFTLDLELALGGVRGLVVNKAGEPRPNANVWILPTEGPRLVAFQADSLVRGKSNMNADAQGRFEFLDLAPGTYVLLAGGENLEHPGGEAGRTQLHVQVRAEEIVDGLVLRVPDAGRVMGMIRDQEHRPCASLDVYLRTSSGELLQPLPICRSNARGVFRCDGLAPGTYTFFARGEEQPLAGRGPVATRESQPFVVQACTEDAPSTGIDVELVADSATLLRVAVRDEHDVSLPAQVRVLDELGREIGGVLGDGDLDDEFEHGAFGHRSRFGPLAPGTYALEARTESGQVATQKFTLAGESERKLTVRVD